MKRRQKVLEGQIVAVPATDGSGVVMGVVARAEKSRSLGASILLFLFAPRLLQLPSSIDTTHLKASDAISVVRTGVRRIVEGDWPIIGTIPKFSWADWPIPIFGNISIADPSVAWLTKYHEDWSGEVQREEWIVAPEVAKTYPVCGVVGVDIAAHEATEKLKYMELRRH